MRRMLLYILGISGLNIAVNMVVVATMTLVLQEMLYSTEANELMQILQTEYPVETLISFIFSFVFPTVFIISYAMPVALFFYRKEKNPQAIIAAEIKKVKRRTLNSALVMAMWAYSGWIVGNLSTMSVMLYYDLEMTLKTSVEFLLTMVVFSTFTFAMVYYGLDLLVRKYIIHWVFEPTEKLSQYKTINLTITSRLLILYSATGLLPVTVLGSMMLVKMADNQDSGALVEFFVTIAILIFLGLLATYLLATAYNKPLRQLRSAAMAIGRSDFEVKVPVVSNDETGVLAETLNETAVALKDKEFINETFGRIVDPSVRDFLLKGNVDLGGGIQTATILFSDIRGFTSLSEKLSAEQVVKLLNRYFTEISACVTEYRGMVNKYIGDAVLAVFGTPVQMQDHAVAAVKAARAMIEARDCLNQQLLKEGLPQIQTGVGIHTGEVVAGNIGSQTRMEFTVIGDTVNTASRLETATKKAGRQIIISEQTMLLIQDEFRTHSLGSIRLKGKEKPVKIYSVS